MWKYNEKVIDHFRNPRNVGEIPNADGVGEAGSLACGDALKLFFKLDAQKRITEAKFQTFGCGSAIASGSALTEIMKGKTLAEVEKLTNQDIVDYLGGLPTEKIHCSVMGREALDAAIANYKGIDLPKKEEVIVCHCFGLTDHEIERVVRDNKLKSIDEVTNYCKAGGGCQTCHPQIQEIIDQVWGEALQIEKKEKEPKKFKDLTNLEKMRLVEETLDREIRPKLAIDGGDLELIDIQEETVSIALRGHCSFCRSSQFTLDKFVGETLRTFVSPDLKIKEIKP